MELKLCGDGSESGWGWKQSLRGRVGMGVISVPVHVSTMYLLASIACGKSVVLTTEINYNLFELL